MRHFIILLLFVVFSIFHTTAFSAKCKVNDPDISNEYIGPCKNGLAHGIGVAKGRDEYRGEFFNGDVHGLGVYIWGPSSQWAGERYEGEHKNGNRTGKGTMFLADGTIAEGNFLNGSLNGKGTVKFLDGRTLVGTFINSRPDGFGIYTVPVKVYAGNRYSGKGELGSEAYVEKGLFRNGEFIQACPDMDTCVEKMVKSEARRAKAYDADYRDINTLFFDGLAKAQRKTVFFDAKLMEIERTGRGIAMSVIADTTTELKYWRIYFNNNQQNIVNALNSWQKLSVVCRVNTDYYGYYDHYMGCDLVELVVN